MEAGEGKRKEINQEAKSSFSWATSFCLDLVKGDQEMDQMEKSSSFEQLIHALEEERQKVEVFHRELPLCLHLINQTIERYKQLMVANENPRHQLKLISLRPTFSGEGQPLLPSVAVRPEKPIARRSWGDSQLLLGPFDVEHQTITDADNTSGEAGDEAANDGGSQGEVKGKEKDKCHGKSKVRRNWSDELHRRFVLALEQLGGCHAATPKRIRKLMKVEGLTNDEIKSHLQKFRIHARRARPVLQSGGNGDQAANYVVVRGIWIPTPAGLVEFDDSRRGGERQ